MKPLEFLERRNSTYAFTLEIVGISVRALRPEEGCRAGINQGVIEAYSHTSARCRLKPLNAVLEDK